MRCTVFLLCAVLMVISGCTGGPEDARLVDVAEKVSDSPEEMLARLDSIDVGSLKESDRYLHALLRIKAQDKAYVKHTSDSVILKVIDYYSGHKGSGHYPEALYYGGRVYSDIGDAPTSLRYFQEALDALPENADKGFRATILSQTGRLLNYLRLYVEAAGYIKEAIKLQAENTDSIKVMRDTQLLGAIYMHAEDYDMADSCFYQARNIARAVSPVDTIQQNMYLAAVRLKCNDTDSALKLISPLLPPRHRRFYRDMIMAYAAQIYFSAGYFDSAHVYAEQLIKSEDINYQKNGYYILFRPLLRTYTNNDSLVSYAASYADVIEKYLDRYDSEQETMQTSLYNYELHERRRIKADASKVRYRSAAVISIIVLFIICILALYFRNKHIKTLLLYHEALDDILHLRHSLAQSKVKVKELSVEDKEKNDLRDRLKNELLDLYKTGKAQKEVPAEILGSLAYKRLQEYITADRLITERDTLWIELEDVVLKVSPVFKSRLYLLAGDRLKADAYHLALLIKCGVTPKEMSVLTGRSKGAVSSRRGYLCASIFGERLGAKVMDDIIKLL